MCRPSRSRVKNEVTVDPIVLDLDHAAVEMDGPALRADPVAGHFPHLAGPEPRILELIDQGLDDLASARSETAEQSRRDGAHQVQVLDPLGRPVGRDGAGRHPPDLLGVRLEEDLEELAAEAVDDPILDAPLGLDRGQPGLEVARHDPERAQEAQLPERIDGLERIMEELAVVVDPAEPRPSEQLVAQDLAPEPVDLVALREEPVSADVEAIAFVLVGPADAADQPRVGFENDARLAVLAQLVGGGQPGRAAAGDDGLVGRHDRDRRRIINPRPAMGNEPGA